MSPSEIPKHRSVRGHPEPGGGAATILVEDVKNGAQVDKGILGLFSFRLRERAENP